MDTALLPEKISSAVKMRKPCFSFTCQAEDTTLKRGTCLPFAECLATLGG